MNDNAAVGVDIQMGVMFVKAGTNLDLVMVRDAFAQVGPRHTSEMRWWRHKQKLPKKHPNAARSIRKCVSSIFWI